MSLGILPGRADLPGPRAADRPSDRRTDRGADRSHFERDLADARRAETERSAGARGERPATASRDDVARSDVAPDAHTHTDGPVERAGESRAQAAAPAEDALLVALITGGGLGEPGQAGAPDVADPAASGAGAAARSLVGTETAAPGAPGPSAVATLAAATAATVANADADAAAGAVAADRAGLTASAAADATRSGDASRLTGTIAGTADGAQETTERAGLTAPGAGSAARSGDGSVAPAPAPGATATSAAPLTDGPGTGTESLLDRAGVAAGDAGSAARSGDGTGTTATSTGTSASAALAGAGAAGPTAGTASPAASSPAAPALPTPAVPLAEQLSGQLGVRLAGIKALPQGEHVLTLRVDPESFGPVRVVAHIGPEGVRIELFGAGDQAREALRAALPDLRRDLAASGLTGDLDLGRERAGDARSQADGRAAADGSPRDGGARSSGAGADGTGDPRATGSAHLAHGGAVDLPPGTLSDPLTGLPVRLDLVV